MVELMNTPTSRKFEMKDKLHKKKHDKEVLELLFPLRQIAKKKKKKKKKT